MIIVELKQKLSSHKRNTFTINGNDVELYWKINRLRDLGEIVNEIHHCLIEKDILKLSEIIKLRENIVYTILVSAFSRQFRDLLDYACHLLKEEKVVLSTIKLYRLLKYGSIENLSKSKHSIAFYNDELRQFLEQHTEEFIGKVKEKIKTALINFDKPTLWGLSEFFYKDTFFHICMNDFKEEYVKYLWHCANDFIEARFITDGWSNLLNYSLIGSMDRYNPTLSIADYFKKNDNIFKTVSLDIYQRQLEECKNWKYQFDSDEWKVYYTHLHSIHCKTYDFSSFNRTMKIEVKKYIQSLFSTRVSYRHITSSLSFIKIGLSELNQLPYKDIESFLDINYLHVYHLFTHVQTVKDQDGERKYHLSYIRKMFTDMKLFFDWLLEYMYPNSDISNPFERITFNNTPAYSESTKYIPEEVIEQMEDKLGELPEFVQNTWTIMMNTGMRISDVLVLEENCLHYDKEKQLMILRYIPFKIRNMRNDLGLDPYHEIPVKQAVVDAIQSQIELSKEWRFTVNTKYIFINKKNNIITQYHPQTTAEWINKILDKYDIKDNLGERFYYTNHQCRKTLAVELYSNGATIEDVATFLAQGERTAGTYYKDIQLKKIIELDAQHFEKMFDHIISPEIKNAYSEEEKQSLIQEFKLGARETPEGHGTCVKHISLGPCQKKSCVGCKMLLTGPQKLPKWYKLYREQQDYIEEIEQQYKEKNITDYQNYREYQREKHLLQIYENTINHTEAFARKEGIPIEKE
jgi:integrase